MSRPRRWAELGWRDVSPRAMAGTIAVLPVAAIEQHGPHLPLGTDLMIMEGHLDRVVARLPAGLDVLVLPTQAVGASAEHAAFPGTLSLRPEAALAAWRDIGAGVARAGCRKLVVVTSHGGNSALIDILALELRTAHAMLAVTTSWSRFGYPDGLFSEHERAHGIHAGDIETSLMLAFRPELVAMARARDFASAGAGMEDEFTWLRTGRPAGFAWAAQDLSPDGAVGDASAATARKGEACADYGATAFVELLQDMAAFDLDRLEPGPLGR